MQPDICLSLRAVDGSAARLARPLVTALTGVHGDLVITLRTLEDQVDAMMVRERVLASLFGFFGALALLLAGLGLDGVTAYSVSRRRSEIGIRSAQRQTCRYRHARLAADRRSRTDRRGRGTDRQLVALAVRGPVAGWARPE